MTKHISRPKRIIISHVYSSDNKGDAALTSVLIRDLKRKFKDATITILKLDTVAPNEHFETIPVQPSFMSYALNKYQNPLAKLAYTVFMICATLLWAVWYRLAEAHVYLPQHLREIAMLYQQADLIVPVGGGYIRSRKGLMHRLNIPLLLHPLLLGDLLGKPTILYAQSVGPFQNRFEEMLAAFVLKRMTLIMIREDTSVALLASIGVSNNVTRAIDSGFLLSSRKKVALRKTYHIPSTALLIGVTVRDWLKGEAQHRYEQAVAHALDSLVESSQAHVVFIPQVTAAKGDDDRVVSRRVRDRMQHTSSTTLIDDVPDHHHIKALYDNLDILLGTRFHSVIFSLTSHVPVLAIEYEHKTSGIMHDLGLEDWVIKIEDVTVPRLTDLLQKLVQEQTEYQLYLTKAMPPYIEQAQKSADLLAQNYSMTTQAQSGNNGVIKIYN